MTTADPVQIEATRQRMMRRYERAMRRRAEMLGRIHERANVLLVEDAFVAVLHELKQVVYDFKYFAITSGRATKNNWEKLVNVWRDAYFARDSYPESKALWDQMLRIRDLEVHASPVRAEFKSEPYEEPFFKDGEEVIAVRDWYIVKLEGEAESDLFHIVNVGCRTVWRLIHEFDTI